MASISPFRWLISFAAILLCVASHAKDTSGALAKLALESPDSAISVVLQLSTRTTITQLVELTQIYRLDEMQVGGRRLTNGREGILVSLTFSSLATPEQQQRQAKCALLKTFGRFSFSAKTMNAIDEEFPGEPKPWWFTEAIITTNAAEAYRLEQTIHDPIIRATPYELIPPDRLDRIRKNVIDLMSKESCQ